MHKTILCLIASASIGMGAQLLLSPSNVIGSSGSLQLSGSSFVANNILDTQSGPITDVFGVNYWINPDNGPANAWITIDLGSAFVIDQLELFNTHNTQYNDRGTGNFNFTAANAVSNVGPNGFDLTGPVTTIASGALSAQSCCGNIPGQIFAGSSSNAFRYIRFNPTSVNTTGTPCCGTNVYGLNELWVFGSVAAPVPEPGSMLLVPAFGGLMWWRRRSRRG